MGNNDGLTRREWRAIGVFAAIVLAVSLVNHQIAMGLVAVFAAAALIRNSGQLAGWLGAK